MATGGSPPKPFHLMPRGDWEHKVAGYIDALATACNGVALAVDLYRDNNYRNHNDEDLFTQSHRYRGFFLQQIRDNVRLIKDAMRGTHTSTNPMVLIYERYNRPTPPEPGPYSTTVNTVRALPSRDTGSRSRTGEANYSTLLLAQTIDKQIDEFLEYAERIGRNQPPGDYEIKRLQFLRYASEFRQLYNECASSYIPNAVPDQEEKEEEDNLPDFPPLPARMQGRNSVGGLAYWGSDTEANMEMDDGPRDPL